MSGKRFVRSSSYRHVHGDPAKPDKCYQDIRPQTSGDGDFVKANATFLAFAAQGGGGPLIVHPLNKTGRLGNSTPKLTVHKGKVLDFAFNPFIETMIATASEDCYTKVSAVPKDGMTENISKELVKLEGHQKKVHLCKWHPTANNILATGSFDYTVKIWDVEAQAEVLNVDDHKDAISHMDWNTDGSLMATTAKDKIVRVFDPRQAGSAMEAESFKGGKKSSCLWADNHGKLITVGFSKSSTRMYSLWDPKKMDKPLHEGDIDQSAGVFMCKYDPDNSILYLAGKGDSSIKYYEIVDEAPYMHFLSESRASNSQKGIGWVSKTALDVKSCEIARALRLLRDEIQPVSFQVPRKSEIFQADIYPDTYAGVKAQDAAAYLGGGNADPVLTSMKPGEGVEKTEVAFVAKKSPAELQTELDAANAKIKELEAEIAKLKSA